MCVIYSTHWERKFTVNIFTRVPFFRCILTINKFFACWLPLFSCHLWKCCHIWSSLPHQFQSLWFWLLWCFILSEFISTITFIWKLWRKREKIRKQGETDRNWKLPSVFKRVLYVEKPTWQVGTLGWCCNSNSFLKMEKLLSYCTNKFHFSRRLLTDWLHWRHICWYLSTTELWEQISTFVLLRSLLPCF